MPKPGTTHLSEQVSIAPFFHGHGQGAINLALAIALLVSFAGIAWNNSALASPATGEHVVITARQAATPTPDTECEPHGPLRYTPDELLAMSFDDWPVRQYAPLETAPLDVGQAAVAAYEASRICQMVDLERSAQTNSPNPLAPSEATMSYYSDRWQLFILRTTSRDVLDDETREFLMNGGDRQLMEHGMLPVNQPMTWHVGDNANRTFPSFAPSEVYTLMDGRYGAMIGTISMHTILTGRGSGAGLQDGGLVEFVAFVDIDGTLYIDERLVVCVTDLLIPAPESTPTVQNEPATTRSSC